MIYIGYPGIGKTTLGGKNQFIDLESSLFHEGTNPNSLNWIERYCKVADDLSQQGYDVFMSSHKQVRQYLSTNKIPYICIFPSLKLKEQWINHLSQRTPSIKNKKALDRALTHYEEDIKDLLNEPYIIVLHSLNYDLEELI